MINIISGYRHYEELAQRIGVDRIIERYEYIYEEMTKFIQTLSQTRDYPEIPVRINDRALMHAVLEYFEDIEKVKSAHDLEHTNSTKITAYMAYWLIRRHPIQLSSLDCDDDLVFINEKFVLSMLISFMTHGSETQPLTEIDREIYIAFVNTFYYFLKFRRLDPQSIEMILLAFRLGGVFPDCKDVE